MVAHSFCYRRVVTWPPDASWAEPEWVLARRARRRRLRARAWMLLLAVPFGLTTWAAFVYIGIRARRPQWLAFSALYAALVAAYLVLDTPAHVGGTAKGVAAVLGILAWGGGGVHGLAISGDAVRRIQASSDPALDAGAPGVERRTQGRHLLARQPALAREIGVGRPDIPGADDFGLVDVNHAPASALTRLPGVGDELARRIIEKRDQAGGFSSVEDLGLVLDLPPGLVDQMRDMAVFVPD